MRLRTRWIAAALLLFSTAAAADTGARDLQVIARAVGFVSGLPRGEFGAAVVDGPGADAVLALMGSGVSGGGVTLIPERVSVANLARSNARVIIVPEGQSAAFPAIAAAAARLHAVTVSTDMSCVTGNFCVIGVASSPRVEIVVSRRATDASGVSFSPSFRVMIREI